MFTSTANPDAMTAAQFRYYPFIDGLRAVAVFLVVLFHFDLGFPGGFIGVDVFFVISGFLITSLIFGRLETNSFSLAVFWEKRARRILPALFIVIFASLVAGWFLLLPRDFAELGRSVLSQAVFLQNVFFWSGEGYFAAPSEVKPLLHTWSLAIEEQFYFLLPLLIVALGFRAKKFWLMLFSALCLLSFGTSVVAVSNFPGAAFYLLPSRAWELLLGAIVAMAPQPCVPRAAKEMCTLLALVSLLLVSLSYSATTPFPVWSALPPCAATALVIFLSRENPPSAVTILELKPMVFVGLVSYSFYLWHWPLAVYLRYWALEPMSVSQSVCAVALSFALGVLSWKFVEVPFRQNVRIFTRTRVFALSARAVVFWACAGALIVGLDGIRERLPEHVIRHDTVAREELFLNEMELEAVKTGKWMKLGDSQSDRPDIMLWGDSLAMALCPAIDDICREHNFHGIAITRSATAPLLGFSSMGFHALKEKSPEFAQKVTDLAQKIKPKVVILAAAWNGYSEQENAAESTRHRGDFWMSLERTVKTLRDSGAKVWIVLEPPAHKHNVPRILARRSLFDVPPGSSVTSPADHDRRAAPFFRRLAACVGSNALLIDPSSLLRQQAKGSDAFFRITDDDGNALYRDRIHLSSFGARLVKPLFEDALGDERSKR